MQCGLVCFVFDADETDLDGCAIGNGEVEGFADLGGSVESHEGLDAMIIRATRTWRITLDHFATKQVDLILRISLPQAQGSIRIFIQRGGVEGCRDSL